MTTAQLITTRAAALAGPSLMGGCLGAPFGEAAFVLGALGFPLALAGLSAVLLPPLCLVVIVLDRETRIDHIAEAALAACTDLGLVLAALSPATALLLAVTVEPTTPFVLAVLAIALAIGASLRALFVRLIDIATTRQGALTAAFLLWSAAYIGLGVSATVVAFDLISATL